MIKFPKYFRAYGGLNALVQSRYFILAAVTSVMCWRYFTSPKWWDIVLSIVPGLVGFSMAGVAIFVSLGSDSLRAVIAGKKKGESDESPFMSFMAMFTHFIVVQLLALIAAFLSKAMFEGRPIQIAVLVELVNEFKNPFWVFGGFCFLYAMFLCVALAVEIYRLASMIDDYQTAVNNSEDGDD